MLITNNGRLTAAIRCSQKNRSEHRSSTDFHFAQIADIRHAIQIHKQTAYLTNFENQLDIQVFHFSRPSRYGGSSCTAKVVKSVLVGARWCSERSVSEHRFSRPFFAF